MVSKEEVLSITRQCQLLDLSRSTYYYAPEPVSEEELELMRLIDQCYLHRNAVSQAQPEFGKSSA